MSYKLISFFHYYSGVCNIAFSRCCFSWWSGWKKREWGFFNFIYFLNSRNIYSFKLRFYWIAFRREKSDMFLFLFFQLLTGYSIIQTRWKFIKNYKYIIVDTLNHFSSAFHHQVAKEKKNISYLPNQNWKGYLIQIYIYR